MSEKKMILIVEDEPDVGTFLKTLLEDNDYDATIAVNGRAGYEAAAELKPSLITLDITMPEESGLRMFRDLQADEDLAKIPVVIVTGVSPELKGFIEHRKQVRAPDAYLEKPVNRDEFLATVARLVKN